MPSSHQQPVRLTKKQKKATAFRERGSSKSKGKGKGTIINKHPNPIPGHHSRPLTTTGDNGEVGYDSDEDANAIPAMEDQDEALAAMAEDTEEGDAKRDDSVEGHGRAVRVPIPKKTTVESTSTAAQNKRKRGSRAEVHGEGQAQSGPKKKARLARSSVEVLPPAAHQVDDATSMSTNDGGDGSKTKSKGSKPLRNILFIGNASVCSSPLTIDRAVLKGISSTPRRAKQFKTTSPYAVRFLLFPFPS